MTQTIAGTLPAPAQRAGNILRAWVRLDPETLQSEFSKGLALCSSSRIAGLEGKRLDLPNDPIVKLCIRLLMHLPDRDASEQPAAR